MHCTQLHWSALNWPELQCTRPVSNALLPLKMGCYVSHYAPALCCKLQLAIHISLHSSPLGQCLISKWGLVWRVIFLWQSCYNFCCVCIHNLNWKFYWQYCICKWVSMRGQSDSVQCRAEGCMIQCKLAVHYSAMMIRCEDMMQCNVYLTTRNPLQRNDDTVRWYDTMQYMIQLTVHYIAIHFSAMDSCVM